MAHPNQFEEAEVEAACAVGRAQPNQFEEAVAGLVEQVVEQADSADRVPDADAPLEAELAGTEADDRVVGPEAEAVEIVAEAVVVPALDKVLDLVDYTAG
jgi:hypothetical protein